MKTAALYARVSTLDQNCEVQLEDLRRYAGQRFSPYREYIDVGVSGAQRHRPQLDVLMKDARKRLFDVVLVWKFDRFARSLKQLIESLDEFSSLGIDFVSYTEGVDTTTPTGQLLFHIVGAVAQFERDLIAERVRAGMAHARAMGKRIGRPRVPVDKERIVKSAVSRCPSEASRWPSAFQFRGFAGPWLLRPPSSLHRQRKWNDFDAGPCSVDPQRGCRYDGPFARDSGTVALAKAGNSVFEDRACRAIPFRRRSSLPRELQGFCLRSQRKETDLSVYKRGNVYWFDFWFRGQRIRESTGLTNKVAAQQAEAIRKAALAEGRAGIAAPKPVVHFGDFVRSEFLPWAEKQYQSHPRTYQRYRESTKPLLASFDKLRLDAVSMALVEKFKLSRSSEVSPATVNRDLAVLRLILNLAIRKEYIAKNPVKEVQFLDEGPGQMRIVSYEEEQKYMAAASPLLRDVATLIVETGMRPEEVFTIRKENVHLNVGYLFVPSGKTHFARRNVPLTEATMDILKKRLAMAGGPFVFPRRGDSDKPLTTVRKAHYKALRAANIKCPFRLYDFRHTFGSRSAMAGVDLPTLKELMGHSDISTTMRYVHPTPKHKQEAVQKLERYNEEQVFALYEPGLGSPQKSPQ